MALSTPEEVKTTIETVQTSFRRVLADRAARWTRREQFHLTLRFLGNVETARIAELIEMAQSACRSFASLKLMARGVGFFPDARFPRVLWMGVKDQMQQLPLLWQAMMSATAPFTAEQPEDRFVGHVTLARLNRLRRPEVENLAREAKNLEGKLFAEWTATRLELMRSELSQQGARHTVLAELPLLGK